jgi:hypothetical protein
MIAPARPKFVRPVQLRRSPLRTTRPPPCRARHPSKQHGGRACRAAALPRGLRETAGHPRRTWPRQCNDGRAVRHAQRPADVVRANPMLTESFGPATRGIPRPGRRPGPFAGDVDIRQLFPSCCSPPAIGPWQDWDRTVSNALSGFAADTPLMAAPGSRYCAASRAGRDDLRMALGAIWAGPDRLPVHAFSDQPHESLLA